MAHSTTHGFSIQRGDDSSGTSSANRKICVQRITARIQEWPEEDWSGIADLKLRRRLQNRLNQRARRLKKVEGPQCLPTRRSGDSADPSSAAELGCAPVAPPLASYPGQAVRTLSDHEESTALAALRKVENIHVLHPDISHPESVLQHIEAVAREQHPSGDPRSDMLLHLIQFNFTRGQLQTMRILGLTSEHMDDDAISFFNLPGPWPHEMVQSLPASLQPTLVQRTVVHHPWLDLLPLPAMRDNLILAGESYDETKLCLDMKGLGSVHGEYSGIIIWSDPWDPSGWEITEPFSRSWEWVLRGCWEIFHSTNAWRARRNEEALFPVT
ncbi:DUF3425 domain-containing protein [Aspergillus fijiensis CBS 313.89]|uniref:BZIP domain-containing protein n=1 Tax=Aspergillus fijiensis CBS 313.89 TaxID=1448319 RepID=A0A8G1RZZ9_9EURO|nr:uncharacterized protein BO72DRAFT_524279 [Aspergillus fijiensis CBS 313.89]RAK81897.1 hypothetical protein BO72DRAFT_524279 [Aspergillus fijiensis CBS 313.89]